MKEQINPSNKIVAVASIARLADGDSRHTQPSLAVAENIPTTMGVMRRNSTTAVHSADAKARDHKSPTLHVNDLHAHVNEATLYDVLRTVGPITSIRVCRDRMTGRSLGYGYITFGTVEDAEQALATMNYFNGVETFGKPLRLMWHMRDGSWWRHGESNIFVRGLAKKIDSEALHNTFLQFGEIWSCKVATDGVGKSLRYGYVHFIEVSAARAAIATMDGKELEGRKVEVSAFKRRQEREAAGHHGRVFTNVYVKHLNEEQCSEGALRSLFEAYGPITSVFVPRHTDGTAKRFAFVNFASAEMAVRAVSEMHGRALSGVECNDSARAASEGSRAAQNRGDDANVECKLLYVCRAQSKSERESALRKKFARIRRQQAERREGRSVYVKHLSAEVDTQVLRAHFATMGGITSCAVKRDARGLSRGFGFVGFATKAEARKAVKQMNRAILCSKQLYVAIAERKEVRRAYVRKQRNEIVPERMASAAAVAGTAGGSANISMTPTIFPPGEMHAQTTSYSPDTQVSDLAPIAVQTPGFPHLHGPGTSPSPSSSPSPSPSPPAIASLPQTPPPTAPSASIIAQNLEPLTLDMLTAAASPVQRNDIVGVRLYPRVAAVVRTFTETIKGKITGMLLELDNTELLHLLQTEDALAERVHEAEEALSEQAKSTANADASEETKCANSAQTTKGAQPDRADNPTM